MTNRSIGTESILFYSAIIPWELQAKALTPTRLYYSINACSSKSGSTLIPIPNWRIKSTIVWSFKRFLGLSFSKPSPDHSTFSRFRARLSKEALDQINSEILRQFESQGLTINEGIAVDARLVKSASRPISNDKIKQARDKHNTPEGKLDKNGKPLKFHRDLNSDWVVQKDIPHYGLKEHASVDTNHGFVLATTMTPASFNDTKYLPYCTAFSRHTKQKIKKVYADKGYAGKPQPGLPGP